MSRDLRAFTLVVLGIVCGLVWGGACDSSSETAASTQQGPGWTELQSVTLTANATGVTFDNIPAGYRFFRLLSSYRHGAATSLILRFNDDFQANYWMATTSMAGNSVTGVGAAGYTAVTYGSAAVNTEVFTRVSISNNPAQWKTVDLTEQVGAGCVFRYGYWNNTTAEIGKITIVSNGSFLYAGSRFVLMGMN